MVLTRRIFCSQRGADAFREFLDGAVDALEHKLNVMTARLGSRPAMHQINQALEEMLTTLAAAPRLQSGTDGSSLGLREHQVLAQLARQFRRCRRRIAVAIGRFARRAKSASTADCQRAGDSTAAAIPVVTELSVWERELLEIVLLEPEGVAPAAEVIPPEKLRFAAGVARFLRAAAN